MNIKRLAMPTWLFFYTHANGFWGQKNLDFWNLVLKERLFQNSRCKNWDFAASCDIAAQGVHAQCLFLIWCFIAAQFHHLSTYESHFYVPAHYSSFITSEKLKTHAQRDPLPYLYGLNGLSPASGLFEHLHLLFLVWTWPTTKCFVFTADFLRICANSLAKNRTDFYIPSGSGL